MGFMWADYLVCVFVLLVSSIVGIYYRFTGGKQKTAEEFLLANSDANVYLVACSLMATFMSSITLLGVSSEIYTFGTQFFVINFSYGIFTPIIAHLYLPVFYKLKTISVYEYLQRRFGVIARLSASLAFSFQMILYMGIVVYAPALALEAVTGIKHFYAIFIMGCVCTFYAGLGGLKAVLFTDMLQTFLMFSAVFSVITSALLEVGWTEIWKISSDRERVELLNFSVDPTVRQTWWSNIIGGGLTFTSLYAVNQAQVQRYLSLKNLKTAQKALYLNWPILTLLSATTCFSGLCIFSKYYSCDPLLTERITSPDQLMPLYVIDTMSQYPGVSGLFVAGIFSGSLSTMSSALNSLSAVTVEDYIKPAIKHLKHREIDETTASICTKFLCVVYGFVCLAIAFLSKYLGAVLQASLTVFGVVGGPLIGIYTLGMFVPLANEIGAVTGLFFGLIVGLWMGFGGPKPPPPMLPKWSSPEGCAMYDDIKVTTFKNFTPPVVNPSDYMYVYRLSYQWYIVIAFLCTLSIGTFVSWIVKKVKHLDDLDETELFVTPIGRLLEKKKKKKQATESIVPETNAPDISLNNVPTQKPETESKTSVAKDKV